MRALISLLFCFVLFVISIMFFTQKPVKNLPYFGIALENPIDSELLLNERERLEVKPELVLFYVRWPKAGEQQEMHWVEENLLAIHQIGALPILSLEPQDLDHDSNRPYLVKLAAILKRLQFPVALRLAHEMNLDSYPWGARSEKSPEQYKEFFRRTVKEMRHMSVHNILWVYCPNADSVPDLPWNTISAYYPGKEYVDILGLDGYNWNTPWRSFREIFEKPLQDLRELDREAPVFICETASAEALHEKKKWLKDALYDSTELHINGFIWFDINKEHDWRVEEIGAFAPLMRFKPTAGQFAETLLQRGKWK